MDSLSKTKNDAIAKVEMPHYYEMTLSDGQKRHCGTMRDVECILSIYPDAVYAKILLPPAPSTVDVPHVTIKEQELPMQQSLPESTLEELNLNQ